MKKLARFFQSLTTLPIILGLSLIGGLLTAQYSLKYFENFESFQLGEWRSYPMLGADEADPYTKARSHELGTLALGRAEAIVFYADHDSKGRPLNSAYDYRLKGNIPETDFFTLYILNDKNKTYRSHNYKPDSISSLHLLRNDSFGSFLIFASREPKPGNWLALPEKEQKLKFVLSLYNSTILTTTALKNYSMPIIERVENQRGNYE